MTKSFTSWWLIMLLVLAVGCADADESTSEATIPAVTAPALVTRAPAATLVPTFTPLPQATPLPTATAGPSTVESLDEPAAAEDFNEIIVDLRYAVPATGLARRLQGNRANRITFVDETSGLATAYSNQGGVLLELRQALSGLELEPVPDDCRRCVSIQYQLSLEQVRGEGWLQDPVLLASIENFMSIALGPHFLPETIVGLRRSASPYAPAHSLALTKAGELWSWLATEGQLTPPAAAITDTQPLQARLLSLPVADVNTEYVVRCEGAPVETLFLNPNGEAQLVSIACPEFSLPSLLLPLYLELDNALEPLLADVALPRPASAFPLAALLDYRRLDGNRLTMFQDGRLVMMDTASVSYTSTLSITQVVSLTEALLGSGHLEPGLKTFGVGVSATITPEMATVVPQATSVMVLRGPHGMYDGQWVEPPDLPALAVLDALLDETLGLAPVPPENEGTAEATEAAIEGSSPTPGETPTPTPVPEATPTP